MAIKTASIVQSDDDYRDPKAWRIKLELRQIPSGQYVWFGPDVRLDAEGDTIEEAAEALRWVYGSKEWNLVID